MVGVEHGIEIRRWVFWDRCTYQLLKGAVVYRLLELIHDLMKCTTGKFDKNANSLLADRDLFRAQVLFEQRDTSWRTSNPRDSVMRQGFKSNSRGGVGNQYRPRYEVLTSWSIQNPNRHSSLSARFRVECVDDFVNYPQDTRAINLENLHVSGNRPLMVYGACCLRKSGVGAPMAQKYHSV